MTFWLGFLAGLIVFPVVGFFVLKFLDKRLSEAE